MKNNRKMKILTVVVIILVAAIVLSLIYMAGHQNHVQKEDKAEKTEISVKVENSETVRPENVDFIYVLAQVNVISDKPIELSHFTTDEGIRLDQTDDYKKLLESQQADTSALPDNSPLQKGNNTLFIPVKDQKASSIEVKCDLDGVESMKFQLDQEMTEASSSPEASAEPSETPVPNEPVVAQQDGIQITFSRIFEVDPALCRINGKEAMLASSARVFAAEIGIQKADGDVTIESAEYDTSDGTAFNAEDSSFSYEGNTSAIGNTLHQSDKAYVYFILIGNGETDFDYQGTLKLKLSGMDKTIDAETTLS